MMPGALVSRSVVLIIHAVLLVPSVVAVPFMRPANASERAGSRIPGPQSNHNGKRNKVGDQSSTGGISALLATSTELVATMRTLTAPATVTAGAVTYAASFNRNGELL